MEQLTKADMAREIIRAMIEEGTPFSFPEVRRRIQEKYKVDVVNPTINNIRRELLGGGPAKPGTPTGNSIDVVEAVETIRKIGDAIGWDQVERIVAAFAADSIVRNKTGVLTSETLLLEGESTMTFDSFEQLLQASLPPGLVLNNPGSGTSTLVSYNNGKVCYRRGKSPLYVKIRDLHKAYLRFSGSDTISNQLKSYAPTVFDSKQKGHNCHCTFFFLALQRMGVVDRIWGRGCVGDPFGVTIPMSQASAADTR